MGSESRMSSTLKIRVSIPHLQRDPKICGSPRPVIVTRRKRPNQEKKAKKPSLLITIINNLGQKAWFGFQGWNSRRKRTPRTTLHSFQPMDGKTYEYRWRKNNDTCQKIHFQKNSRTSPPSPWTFSFNSDHTGRTTYGTVKILTINHSSVTPPDERLRKLSFPQSNVGVHESLILLSVKVYCLFGQESSSTTNRPSPSTSKANRNAFANYSSAKGSANMEQLRKRNSLASNEPVCGATPDMIPKQIVRWWSHRLSSSLAMNGMHTESPAWLLWQQPH